MSRLLIATLCAGFAAASCVQGTPDANEQTTATISARVKKTPPEPRHVVGARFSNKVELVGYDLAPARPRPGKSLRITWYWRCIEELGSGYELFTHLVDTSTDRMCAGGNFDDASVDNLRRTYPPGQWHAGEYISDTQRITLPDEISHEEVELRVGIFRGTQRLRITQGPSDPHRRARGPRFATGYKAPPTPELTVPFAAGTLTIDGRLDEPDWSKAAQTGPLVGAGNGRRAGPATKARLLYDAAHLYIAFDCEDRDLFSTFTKRDDPLWTHDAVEVFIDPTGQGTEYFEFQVSPGQKLFDTKLRFAKSAPRPERDDGYDGKSVQGVHRRGTLNDDSDTDEGWTVELAIPWASLAPRPPEPGASWRLNLFRLDGRPQTRRAFLAWSPPLANTTHVPNRFGTITFGPRAGSTPASQPDGAAAQEPAQPQAERDNEQN